MPFVNSTWALRDPAYPLPAERQEIPQNGRGLGDISVTGRYWLFNPETHLDWNVGAGAGLKTPTGNSRYQTTFIGRVDRTDKLRYVDQSVQPGDGGWGLMMEAHAFRIVKGAFLFASGSYLANPQDTNDTPSIISVLELPLTGTVRRAGRELGAGPVSGPRGRIDARLERSNRLDGVARRGAAALRPVRRQPRLAPAGTAMFVEPGIAYTRGAHSILFNVPIRYYRNRHPNPYTGTPGDATFPRHIFLTSYSLRFGARRAPLTPTEPPPTPAVCQPGQ